MRRSFALGIASALAVVTVAAAGAQPLPTELQREVKSGNLTPEEAQLLNGGSPPSTGQAQDSDILAEVRDCLSAKLTNPAATTRAQLLEASQQCAMAVVVLDSQGRRRPDADARALALMRATGVRLPRRETRGSATVVLKLANPREKGAGVFVVPVTVGGKARPFLLDTGATNSIVAANLARGLGLSGIDLPVGLLEQGVVGSQCRGSGLKISLLRLPPLAVAGAHGQNLLGLALPAERIPGGGAGVLGLDFLSGYDLTIDPTVPRLVLAAPTPSAGSIALTSASGILATQVQVNGRGPFTFGLDTGADLIVVSARLARTLGLKPVSARKEPVQGFCGLEAVQRVRLGEVRLGSQPVKNLDGVILTSPLLDRLGIDGLVGQNYLNRFRQHWRFEEPNELGLIPGGSLELQPIGK